MTGRVGVGGGIAGCISANKICSYRSLIGKNTLFWDVIPCTLVGCTKFQGTATIMFPDYRSNGSISVRLHVMPLTKIVMFIFHTFNTSIPAHLK